MDLSNRKLTRNYSLNASKQLIILQHHVSIVQSLSHKLTKQTHHNPSGPLLHSLLCYWEFDIFLSYHLQTCSLSLLGEEFYSVVSRGKLCSDNMQNVQCNFYIVLEKGIFKVSVFLSLGKHFSFTGKRAQRNPLSLL